MEIVMQSKRPSPMNDKNSLGSSRRNVVFFNPALATPTLTATPGSTSEDTPLPFGRRSGPWIVSPPPPPCLEAQQTVDFGVSPAGWLQQKLSRQGLCSSFLAFFVSAVLFFLALGAYVTLVYLAVTTKRPKYIVFSSVLASVFLLIAYNIRSNTPPGGEERERADSENDDNAILRAYGLQPTKKPSPV